MVAFDAISGSIISTGVNSGTNKTTTITLSASATIAVCFIEASCQGGISDSTITFPTLTLGGQAMTQVPSAIDHAGGGSPPGTGTTGFCDLYYLLNPPTGLQTLSITMNYTGAGNSGNLLAFVCSYTGTLQSGAELGTAKRNNGSGVPSLTLTDTLATGDLFVGCAVNGTAAPTVTTGTSRGTATGDTSTASHGGIRVGDNSGSGSINLVFGTNSGDNSASSGVKLVAATAADAGYSQKSARPPGHLSPASIIQHPWPVIVDTTPPPAAPAAGWLPNVIQPEYRRPVLRRPVRLPTPVPSQESAAIPRRVQTAARNFRGWITRRGRAAAPTLDPCPPANLNELLSAYDSADQASAYTTPSISPRGPVLAFVATKVASGSPSQASLSGAGLTWAAVPNSRGVQNQGSIEAFVGTGTPSSGAVTISVSVATIGCAYAFFDLPGCDTTTPVVQGTFSNGGSATSATITFGDESSARNRTVVGVHHYANEQATPQTNWTELSDDFGGSPAFGFETQWRSAVVDLNGGASWATSVAWCMSGVELAAAPCGGIVANPDIVWNLVRRAIRPPKSSRGSVAVTVPPQVNPPLPLKLPNQARALRGWIVRRGRQATFPPPQLEATIPDRTNTQARALRGWITRRGRAPMPTPPQFNPPYPVRGQPPVRQWRALVTKVRRRPQPTPDQTMLPGQPPRRSYRSVRIIGRQATVPASQVAAPPPTLVPKATATRVFRGVLGRRRGGGLEAPPAQVAPTAPTFPPKAVTGRVRRGLVQRRGRQATPTPPQLESPIPRRTPQLRARLPFIRRRGGGLQPVPPQVNPLLPIKRPDLRRALRGWPVRRGSLRVPVRGQVNPPMPLRPQTMRRALRGWITRRGRRIGPWLPQSIATFVGAIRAWASIAEVIKGEADIGTVVAAWAEVKPDIVGTVELSQAVSASASIQPVVEGDAG